MINISFKKPVIENQLADYAYLSGLGCVMLPYILYQAFYKNAVSVLVQIFGLAGMTGLYYLRAITEERHLSIDPEYREYCKRAPYRFIPGIL